MMNSTKTQQEKLMNILDFHGDTKQIFLYKEMIGDKLSVSFLLR